MAPRSHEDSFEPQDNSEEARLRWIIDGQAKEMTDLKQDVNDQKEANVRMVKKVEELVQLFKAFLPPSELNGLEGFVKDVFKTKWSKPFTSDCNF